MDAVTPLQTSRGRFLAYPTEAEWLDARRQFVTASDVAALLGVNPYASLFSVWAAKVSPEPKSDNSAMRAGRKLEPIICEWWAEQAGATIEDPGRWTLCIGDHPHLAATLDRLIVRPFEGVLEAKAPGYLQRDAWEQGPPLLHQVQVQTQMAVTGAERGVIAALIGGQDFRHFEIERNDDLIEVIRDAVDSFWPFVERREMPEIDGHAATVEAVKRLYPQDSGREIEVREVEQEAAFLALEKARAEKKKWQDLEDEAKARVLAIAQDASSVRLPSGDTWTLKTVTKQPYTVTPAPYRDIRKKKGRKA